MGTGVGKGLKSLDMDFICNYRAQHAFRFSSQVATILHSISEAFFIIIDTPFIIFFDSHSIVVNNTYQCRELCIFEKGESGWRRKRITAELIFTDKADPIDCGHESVRDKTFKSKNRIDDRAPWRHRPRR